MNPLDLVELNALMKRTAGSPEVRTALIDGPVAIDHPDLARNKIRSISGKLSGMCTLTNGLFCQHGTFVAGILSAKRGSAARAICPDCTLVVRPIFAETKAVNGQMPAATPEWMGLPRKRIVASLYRRLRGTKRMRPSSLRPQLACFCQAIHFMFS